MLFILKALKELFGKLFTFKALKEMFGGVKLHCAGMFIILCGCGAGGIAAILYLAGVF